MDPRLGGKEDLRAHHRRASRREEVHPPRRSSLCERCDPPRSRRQQDPEGHDPQGKDPRRLPGALRARLGLPRHADRSADRKAPREEPSRRRNAEPRARLRHGAIGAPVEGLQASRHPRRLGQPLPHHELQDGSAGNPRAREDHGKRIRLPRPQARQLVL